MSNEPPEQSAEIISVPMPDPDRQRVKRLFEKYDSNGDGSIDVQELKPLIDQGLSQDIPEKMATNIFKWSDHDGNKKLDFEEFYKLSLTHRWLLSSFLENYCRAIVPRRDRKPHPTHGDSDQTGEPRGDSHPTHTHGDQTAMRPQNLAPCAFAHLAHMVGPALYVAHLSGAVAGLLVGIGVLRNLKERPWERILWWIAVVFYFALMFAGIMFQIFCPDYFPKQEAWTGNIY